MLDLRMLSKAVLSRPSSDQTSHMAPSGKVRPPFCVFPSVRWSPCTSSASPFAFTLQVNSPLLGSGKIRGSGLMADKTSQVATGPRLFLPTERLLSPACFLCKVSQNWVRSQPAVGSRKLALPCVSQPLVQAQELTDCGTAGSSDPCAWVLEFIVDFKMYPLGLGGFPQMCAPCHTLPSLYTRQRVMPRLDYKMSSIGLY